MQFNSIQLGGETRLFVVLAGNLPEGLGASLHSSCGTQYLLVICLRRVAWQDCGLII